MKPNSAFAPHPKLWVAGILLLLLCGCEDPIPFTSQAPGVSNPASGPTWYGPYPLDLGDVRDSTLTTFYKGNAAYLAAGKPQPFFPSSAPYGADTQSYGNFHLEFAPTFGSMAASFYDGAQFRPFGRVYEPLVYGGGGWASYGAQGSFLNDSSSTVDALYVTMGLSPSGAGLVVFSDGEATVDTGSALLRSTQTWSSLPSQQSIGAALVAGNSPMPGKGYVAPSSTGIAGIYANGSPSSAAWDNGGHAYYSYVDQNDTHSVSYVTNYTAFTNWSSGNGVRLGPNTSQTQLLGDGFGVTPLWVGQDLQTANSLALGSNYGCSLSLNGLSCWGNNSSGQVGAGASAGTQVNFPNPVAGISSSVISAAAGKAHICVVMQSGSVVCWGSNTSGESGTGTATSSGQTSPTPVLGITGLANQVSSGDSHSCALMSSTGSVYCWGANNDGQLGLGNTTSEPQATTAVLGLPVGGASQISSGSNHTCALAGSTGDNVYCWGDNTLGELATNNVITPQETAVNVTSVAGFTSIKQVSAGGQFTCALTSSGTVFCWGLNSSGQIGNGDASGSSTPYIVPTAVLNLTGVTQIASGTIHACALLNTGSAYCWGDNSFGELGNGTTSGSPIATPVAVSLPAGVTLTAIAAGNNFSCGITTQGVVLCWGYNGDAECNGVDEVNGITQELTPIESAASANQSLNANWSAPSNFLSFARLSTGDVKSMSAATDGQGNVLTVYLQSQPGFVTAPSGTVTTQYPVRHNDVRVYASMRGASGVWTGPTQTRRRNRVRTDDDDDLSGSLGTRHRQHRRRHRRHRVLHARGRVPGWRQVFGGVRDDGSGEFQFFDLRAGLYCGNGLGSRAPDLSIGHALIRQYGNDRSFQVRQ